MTFDIKKFINDEGLSLKRFDQWLESNTGSEEESPAEHLGENIRPKDEKLLVKFLEGLKGKAAAKSLMKEIKSGSSLVENVGSLLVTIKCGDEIIRIPKPMVEVINK